MLRRDFGETGWHPFPRRESYALSRAGDSAGGSAKAGPYQVYDLIAVSGGNLLPMAHLGRRLDSECYVRANGLSFCVSLGRGGILPPDDRPICWIVLY